ncbi:MAG: glycosyltransferase, partial [Limisphaerales bacterium]
ARHDLILFSDADVRAPRDFLRSMVLPLREPGVALVNCFYRVANPNSRAMEWEAVAINADFWSQVLQSQTLKPLDFALGAAVLLRRKALETVGGFRAFANCLADDYQIGHEIAKNGGQIALCSVVVECWHPPMNWLEVWNHQLRWGRTIRVCQPGPYFLSILSNSTLWPLIWLVDLIVWTKAVDALAPLALMVARAAIAWRLQRRFNEGRQRPAPLWLVPVKDLLQTAIWIAAFCGNKIEWRGRKMRLRRDGNLEPLARPAEALEERASAAAPKPPA